MHPHRLPYHLSVLVFTVVLSASGCASQTQAQHSSLHSNRAVIGAQKLGDAFSTVASAVSNTVVSIGIEQRRKMPMSPFQFFFGQKKQSDHWRVQRGNGSGVIIRSNGYILTNNHVVAEASRIEVQLRDGRKFKGKVVGADAATDLAIIKIDATKLPIASLADSNQVNVGEWVLAIGSPFGLDYTVTAGVVSAIGRGGIGANEIEDYLQTDASINPGNSGGPLVNLKGEVIGINTMIVGRGTGIGFSVPINLAKSVAEQVISTGQVKRAWIGVSFQDLSAELAEQFGLKNTRGALVATVIKGGPAHAAGIQPGDVIRTVEGKSIKVGRDLLRIVLAQPVGKRLKLDIIRNGKAKQVTLKTALRPSSENEGETSSSNSTPSSSAEGMLAKDYGLRVEQLTANLAKRLNIKSKTGLVVAGITSGSPADRIGLKRRDIILEANRRSVKSARELTQALKKSKALLRVQRKDNTFFVVLAK